MLGRCILEVSSIGRSVDRIDYFVRLTATEEDNCNCRRLLFDQPSKSWRHPHQLELVAIRNYCLPTPTSMTRHFRKKVMIRRGNQMKFQLKS